MKTTEKKEQYVLDIIQIVVLIFCKKLTKKIFSNKTTEVKLVLGKHNTSSFHAKVTDCLMSNSQLPRTYCKWSMRFWFDSEIFLFPIFAFNARASTWKKKKKENSKPVRQIIFFLVFHRPWWKWPRLKFLSFEILNFRPCDLNPLTNGIPLDFD